MVKGRRVGVVVGGHVDGLERGDATAPGRGDALLQLTHLVRQGGLVSHRGRHAAEQGGHLGAGLHEAEDVVDEQQHVLVLDVPEVLGHRQRRQGHPQAHAGRLVHLAVHQGGLLDDAGLGHLQPEVVALPGPLAHAGEHRHAPVLLGDTADHLLDDDGLAHSGPAEQTDLAALHVGLQQVDDLDAGLEHLGLGLQGVESGGGPVDLPVVVRLPHLGPVELIPRHVEHVAQDGVADRDRDTPAGAGDRGPPPEAVGRLAGRCSAPGPRRSAGRLPR